MTAERGLDALLEARDCRALVVIARSSRDPFLAPFVGPARLGESLVVAPRGAPARLGFFTPMERREAAATGLPLLSPEDLDLERWQRDGGGPEAILAGAVSRALQLAQVSPSRIALAGLVSAGRLQAACHLLAAEGWSFEPGETLVQQLRKRKTPGELESIRAAAVGTRAAFRHLAHLLATAEDLGGELRRNGEPLTVGHLRRAAARTLAEHGLEQPERNIIAPAEEGAFPHSSGTDTRALRSGESLVVDLFPRGHLFADCTRTFCVGPPPEPLARAHREAAAALATARAEARPGVHGWDLQKRVCRLLEQAGYRTPISHPGTDRGYVHGLGHGVGFELHELPSFRKEAEGDAGALAPGDVITLEPGLYEPDEGWAVRLEDLFVVTEDGVESLTPLPLALDPREWPADGR